MEFFKKKPSRAADVDDYIAMREYATAEAMLKTQLREQPDPQVHMKLGDVLRHQGLGDAAVGEYLAASDQFSQRGFTDRAKAALSRAEKIAAHRPDVVSRVQRMDRRKRLDLIRRRALDALKSQPVSTEGQTSTDAGQASSDNAIPSQVELDRVWEQLSKCEWIHALPNRQLVRILRGMTVHRYEAGKRIAAEGSLNATMLLITEGEVEVRRIGPRGMVALRTFNAGDLIGENSLLKGEAWQASLIAETDCTVLVLKRAGFEEALTGNQDPRGLIAALRAQGNDAEILRLVARL